MYFLQVCCCCWIVYAVFVWRRLLGGLFLIRFGLILIGIVDWFCFCGVFDFFLLYFVIFFLFKTFRFIFVFLLSSPGKFCSGLTCWVPRALGRVGTTPRTPPVAAGAPWTVAPRWVTAATCPTAAAAAAAWGAVWPPRRLMLPRWPTTLPRGTVIPRPWPTP